jgi:hypothetical protein
LAFELDQGLFHYEALLGDLGASFGQGYAIANLLKQALAKLMLEACYAPDDCRWRQTQ